jgi:hypothetical protein
MIITPDRRSFIAGLVSACAAPAIVTSAGFRSGLWLPPVNERWLAYYDMSLDMWTVRVDFLTKDFPMMTPAESGLIKLLPEEKLLQFQRLFGEHIAKARRLAALTDTVYGIETNLTDFMPTPY